MNNVCHKINFSGSDINDSNFDVDPAAVINAKEPVIDLIIYDNVQPAMTL